MCVLVIAEVSEKINKRSVVKKLTPKHKYTDGKMKKTNSSKAFHKGTDVKMVSIYSTNKMNSGRVFAHAPTITLLPISIHLIKLGWLQVVTK